MIKNLRFSIRTQLTSDTALDVYNDDIIELQLLTLNGKPFNVNPEDAWDILVQLYFKYLNTDPLWHFLYEGTSMTALRVSKNNVAALLTFCDLNNVGYKNCGIWKHDSQKPTKDYQKVFTYLFHGFSILAMEVKPNEVQAVMDRVYHCATNPLWYKMSAGEPNWEAFIIARNAIQRAFYAGMCEQYEKSLSAARALAAKE